MLIKLQLLLAYLCCKSWQHSVQAGNTKWRGRLSTDLLNKVACFCKKVKTVLNIKSTWSKLVGTKRSTVLRLSLQLGFPGSGFNGLTYFFIWSTNLSSVLISCHHFWQQLRQDAKSWWVAPGITHAMTFSRMPISQMPFYIMIPSIAQRLNSARE